MKVLHIITTMDRGGAETQLVELANRQTLNGDEISIMFLKGDGKLSNLESAVKFFDLTALPIILQLFQALQIVKREKYHIVSSHLPRSELLGLFVSWMSGTHLIVTKHNSERFWPDGSKFLSKLLSRIVEKRSRRVIHISNSVKEFLFEVGEVNDSLKSTVIPYGVSDNFKSKVSHGTGLNLEVKGEFKLICVARLVPQKNVLFLLDGLTEILDLNPILNIWGEGLERKTIEKRIKSLGLQDRVFLRGISHEILKEIQGADVLVLTSKYEGFGLVLLEAMSVGTKIVASNIPTSREILVDYPLLFEIQSITSLAEKLRASKYYDQNSFEKYAQKRLEAFNIERQVKASRRVYEEVINDN